jgi:hypothetical protein
MPTGGAIESRELLEAVLVEPLARVGERGHELRVRDEQRGQVPRFSGGRSSCGSFRALRLEPLLAAGVVAGAVRARRKVNVVVEHGATTPPSPSTTGSAACTGSPSNGMRF